MTLWFRFYSDAMHDPKVASLSDADHRLWTECLAVAAKNDGIIPPAKQLRHVLNRRLDHLSKALDRLISALLIDPLGDGYAPHNWTKFQYKSDTSTERVHKHRAKRNVSVTAPEPETEPDTEYTPNGVSASGDAPALELIGGTDVVAAALQPSHVIEAWNAMAQRTGLPPVRKITGNRQRQLRSRIREYEVEDWTEAIDAIERSPFCKGDNPRGWRADFDFLLQPKSFTKLLEGSYG